MNPLKNQSREQIRITGWRAFHVSAVGLVLAALGLALSLPLITILGYIASFAGFIGSCFVLRAKLGTKDVG